MRGGIFMLMCWVGAVGQQIAGEGQISVQPIAPVSLNSPTGSLTITLRALNSTQRVDVQGQVRVVCSLRYPFEVSGYTHADFASITTDNTPRKRITISNLNYTVIRAGRLNSLTCEANTVANSTADVQFRSTLSDAVDFQGLLPPKLYFKEPSVKIPNKDWSGKTTLILSSPLVHGSTVTIRCGIVSPAGSTHHLEFMTRNVSGSNTAQVEVAYNINVRSYVPLTVECSAGTIGGMQYLHETSFTDPSAVFTLDRGSTKLSPSDGTVSTPSFQVTLSVEPLVSAAVEFQCKVASFDSVSSAHAYLLPQCPAPPLGNRPTTVAPTTQPPTPPATGVPTTAEVLGTNDLVNETTESLNSTTQEPLDVSSFQLLTNSTTDSHVTADVTTSNATANTSVTTAKTNSAVSFTIANFSSTTTNISTTTTATTTPTTDTSLWRFSFEANETVSIESRKELRTFEVYRREAPLVSLHEYLVISCCALEDTSELRYAGLQAKSVIEFDYVYGGPVNESAIEAGTTVIANPAHVNLAPCPCDLTKDTCDFNCLCDGECTADDQTAFSTPFAGLFGGQNQLPADHFCSRNGRVGAPDWVPFLCTQSEKNAHLGYFYSPSELITKEEQFPSLSTNSYNQPRSEILDSPAHGLDVGYKQGIWLERESGGYFSIPHSIHNGGCLDSSPIRYLIDADSSCSMVMSETLCTSTLSRLNAANYLQTWPPIANLAPFQTVIGLRQAHGNNTLVPVETRFLCIGQYVSQSNQPVEQSPGYLDNNTSSKEASIPYCEWDDGQTYPPSPSVVDGYCTNSVIDVKYDIEYRNKVIVKVVATYTVADIDVERSSNVSYTQSWYEDVVYNRTISTNGSVDNQTSAQVETYTVRSWYNRTAYHSVPVGPVHFSTRYRVTFLPTELKVGTVKYAGKPGYNVDSHLNLISVDRTNITALVPEAPPTLPVPGADGLCEHAGSTLLTFTSNQMSQCHVMLTAADLTDCSALRYQLHQKMEDLFPVIKDGRYISRFGVPNYDRGSQWLPIWRDITQYSENVTSKTSAPPNATTTSATTITSTNTATDMPLSGAEIVTPAVQLAVEGGCVGIPSSAQLMVLYTLAGRSAGAPIYQIVGTRIRVTEVDWSVHCSSGGCDNSTGNAFPLTFTTEYVQVPSTPSVPVARYFKKKQEECISCVPPWTLQSFLYPVAGVPDKLKAENLAMFLFLLSTVLVLWVLSRPWWHKHYWLS